jgi:hypothetical protein
MRFQISLMAFAVVAKTGPLDGFAIAPTASSGHVEIKAEIALDDSGSTAGTPLFVALNMMSGKRTSRAVRSIHSYRSLRSTPCRKVVSIASMNATAT